MNTSALIFIYGWLICCIVLTVGGFFLPDPWWKAAISLGVLGAIAWSIGGLWLMNAMNTDI